MAQGKFEKKARLKQPEQKQEGKAKRIWLKIAIAVLAVLLVVLVVIAVAAEYVLGKIGRLNDQPTEPTAPTATTAPVEQFVTDATEPDETLNVMDPTDVTLKPAEEVQVSNKIINILLVGQDTKTYDERARSDSMILLSLNRKDNTIKMTSILRDTYVQIPGGWMDNRINAAFNLGGYELLNETITHNFGVQIDGNVVINFKAFEKVIDILGGVDIEMDWEEANYMQNRGFYDCVGGMNHLEGDAALIFARMRHVSGGDYTRTERQRRMLTCIVEKLRDSDLTTILGLIEEILPLVSTDLTDAEIISYATLGLSVLAKNPELQSFRIPTDESHYMAFINEMSVMVPDLEKCREELLVFIYGQP